MAKLFQEKHVSSLPGTLAANTLYYVKNGTGFDMYLTNTTGTIVAYPLNSNGSFPKPQVNNIDYAPLQMGETKDIVLTGSYYTETTTVSISNGTDNFIINSIDYDNFGQLTVNVTANVSVDGLYDVRVDNGISIVVVDGISVTSLVSLIPGPTISGGATTLWEGEVGVTLGVGSSIPMSTSVAWGRVAKYGTIPSNTGFSAWFTLEYMTSTGPGSSGGFIIIGVIAASSSLGYLNHLYSVYMDSGNNLSIRKNGNNVAGGAGISTFAITDVLWIKHVGTTLEILKNSTVIWTFTSVTFNFPVDIAMDCNRYVGIGDTETTY